MCTASAKAVGIADIRLLAVQVMVMQTKPDAHQLAAPFACAHAASMSAPAAKGLTDSSFSKMSIDCWPCTQAHSPLVQLQLLAATTRVLGQETWFNCISLLTHGCQAPPDTPQGSPMDWGRALELRKRDLSSQLRSAHSCMVR